MKALFILPKTMEGMLAAIATLQSYRESQNAWARQLKEEMMQLYVGSPNPNLDFLLPALGEYTPVESILVRGEYDIVHQFDEEKSYELSLPTERHIVQCFGMSLGVSPPTFPDLDGVKVPGEIADALNENEIFCDIRGGLTYLACSFGKAVVEIYPADRHRRWLSKWSHKYYAMIYRTWTRELVQSAVEAMACRIGVQISPQDLERTVLRPFIADAAVVR